MDAEEIIQIVLAIGASITVILVFGGDMIVKIIEALRGELPESEDDE